MTYIHFTEERKYCASCTDPMEFLQRQGEKLIRLGPEYRMASDRSVAVRSNEWYDHTSKEGDGLISFVQNHPGLSHPEAVTRLSDGEQGRIYEPAFRKKEEPKKEFIRPPVGREMRKLYIYLLKRRLIDREVLSTSTRAGPVHEDEKYHNAVFVGKDEHGTVRHTRRRSTSGMGKTFRINVEGSDPRYDFHRNGISNRLYVLEAPIDLLPSLTPHPKNWQRHSYVALCGVGRQATLWMLEQAPRTRRPIPCLGHDAADIEATDHLKGILRERGYSEAVVSQSIHKDWNEDAKARCGLEAQGAKEHSQPMTAPEVCKRVCAMSITMKPDRLNNEVPQLIEQYRSHLHWGRFDRAMDCTEQASALAAAACRRESRQLGMAVIEEEVAGALRERIRPHRNRRSLRNRYRVLAPQSQGVPASEDAAGLRIQEEKKTLAGRWLDLAAAFVGAPIQYEAEQTKQREAQSTLNMELGVTL